MNVTGDDNVCGGEAEHDYYAQCNKQDLLRNVRLTRINCTHNYVPQQYCKDLLPYASATPAISVASPATGDRYNARMNPRAHLAGLSPTVGWPQQENPAE